MIGVDTNVLVRYLTQDDPTQTPSAVTMVRSFTPDEPGFISLVVAAELVWVLETGYDFARREITEVLDTLLRSKELVIERADIVSRAVSLFASGNADFADYLIEQSGNAAGCMYTVTFDQQAAISAGMKLLT